MELFEILSGFGRRALHRRRPLLFGSESQRVEISLPDNQCGPLYKRQYGADNIAKKLVKRLISLGKGVLGARVLVMGVTFKENVADIRNSKVVDIINELRDFGCDVDVVDPHADSDEVQKEYGFRLVEKPRDNYDAVVVAVAHDEYKNLDDKYFKGMTYDHAVLVDIKGMYRDKIHSLKYWSL